MDKMKQATAFETTVGQKAGDQGVLMCKLIYVAVHEAELGQHP